MSKVISHIIPEGEMAVFGIDEDNFFVVYHEGNRITVQLKSDDDKVIGENQQCDTETRIYPTINNY